MIPEAVRRLLPFGAGVDPTPIETAPRNKGGTSAGFAPTTRALPADHYGALRPFRSLPTLRFARHQHDPRVVLLTGDEPLGLNDPNEHGAPNELVLDARADAAATRLLLGETRVVIANVDGDLALYPVPAPPPFGPAEVLFAGLDVEPALLTRAAQLEAEGPLAGLTAAGLILRAWTPSDPRARAAALLAGQAPTGAAARVDARLATVSAEALDDWAERAAAFIRAWNVRAQNAEGTQSAQSASLLEHRDRCASLAAVLARPAAARPLPSCAGGDAAIHGRLDLAWPSEHARARWLDAVRAMDPTAWWAAPEWRV